MHSKRWQRLIGAGLKWGWLLAAVAICCGGCGVRRTTAVGGDQAPEDQWSHGVWVYGQRCAGCHGEDLEGDEDSPGLVGDGALPLKPKQGSERTAQFRTAKDLFAYSKAKMPPIDPGGASDKDYWAIVAYILKQGGKYDSDEPIFEGNADKIKLR